MHIRTEEISIFYIKYVSISYTIGKEVVIRYKTVKTPMEVKSFKKTCNFLVVGVFV